MEHPKELPSATVWRFAYDRDGTLLIATSAGLLQLRGRVAQRIAPDVIGRAVDVLLDHSGTLWVATGENVVARMKNDAQFHEVGKITQPFDANTQVLAEAPDGHVWVSDVGLLTRRDPAAPESGAVPMRATDAYNGRLLIDTGGNAWFPSIVAQSLNRWPAEKMAADMHSPERAVHAEIFSKAGLTGVPKTIFEDREHNIWIGTMLGLDRFSPSKVIRVCLNAPDWATRSSAALQGTCGRHVAARGLSKKTRWYRSGTERSLRSAQSQISPRPLAIAAARYGLEGRTKWRLLMARPSLPYRSPMSCAGSTCRRWQRMGAARFGSQSLVTGSTVSSQVSGHRPVLSVCLADRRSSKPRTMTAAFG